MEWKKLKIVLPHHTSPHNFETRKLPHSPCGFSVMCPCVFKREFNLKLIILLSRNCSISACGLSVREQTDGQEAVGHKRICCLSSGRTLQHLSFCFDSHFHLAFYVIYCITLRHHQQEMEMSLVLVICFWFWCFFECFVKLGYRWRPETCLLKAK